LHDYISGADYMQQPAINTLAMIRPPFMIDTALTAYQINNSKNGPPTKPEDVLKKQTKMIAIYKNR